MKKPLISALDPILKERGLYDKVYSAAVKAVIARQIDEERSRQHLTKQQLAHRMHTSRTVLDSLLDPANESVTLKTLQKAAGALGKKLAVAII
ncbi:MAG: XRE family transcriptional regulator [Planctomycetes bacterium]|nr:XRE family transcriptional regulator [Planctomycetota bacterium]